MRPARWEPDVRLLRPLRERLRRPRMPPADFHALRDDHVRRFDPKLHAFVEWRPTAGAPLSQEMPLSVTFKDLIDVAGFPTRCGSPTYRRDPSRSATIASLLERAAMVAGKVRTTHFGVGTTTPCVNPRFPAFTPSGSSTGSAVAVASGFCDVSVGTDTSASVRHPAACCGVVGLRMTPRRQLSPGTTPVSPTLDGLGLITRTADDLDAVWNLPALHGLRVATGAEPLPPGRPLSFGWLTNWQDEPVHPAVAARWTDVTTALRGAGVTLSPVSVAWWRYREQMWPLLSREFADTHAERAREQPAERTADVSALVEQGRVVTDREYRELRALQRAAEREAERDLAEVDVLVLPSDPDLPRPVAAPARRTVAPEPTAGDAVADLGFLEVAAMPRLPALALPAGTSDDGAPLALQLLARRGGDGLLVAAARRLERILLDADLAVV